MDFEKVISGYLKQQAEIDQNLADGMKAECKSMEGCIKYITERAREMADEVGRAAVEDAVVYGWAVHYFIESEDTIKAEIEKITGNATRANAANYKREEGHDDKEADDDDAIADVKTLVKKYKDMSIDEKIAIKERDVMKCKKELAIATKQLSNLKSERAAQMIVATEEGDLFAEL